MTAAELFRKAVAHHQRGEFTEAEILYRRVQMIQPLHAESLHNLGVIALQRGEHQIAVDLIKQSLTQRQRNPEAHYNIGLAYASLHKMVDAERHIRCAVSQKPNCAEAHMNLGNTLLALGNRDEAIKCLKRARKLNPDNAEIHFSLANALFNQGDIGAAIESYERALTLRPNYLDALQNLATTLFSCGHHRDAAARFREALAVRPDFAPAMVGLALALHTMDQAEEAITWVCRSIDIQPTSEAKAIFASCVFRLRIIPDVLRLRDHLIAALSEPWARPRDLATFAVALLMRHGVVNDLIKHKHMHRPEKFEITDTHIAALGADSLLTTLMANSQIPNLDVESLLTAIRSYLLKRASENARFDESLIAFACTMAHQCFLNEYVYDCSEFERAAAHTLRGRISATIADSSTPAPFEIAVVAAYFPLYELPDAARLLKPTWPTPIYDLLDLQIRAPLEEARLKAEIRRLTEVEDHVSRKVQNQYEENPYPRWFKLPPSPNPLPLHRYLKRLLPQAEIRRQDRSHVDVLVAGCGTGLQPIEVAQAIAGAEVLAVDLSLASLAYAQRRANDLMVSNIQFAQADILQLPGIGRVFDLVDAEGVLHHMADPFAAWRGLSDMVKPGGVMRVGLYSEIARRGIQKCRKLVFCRGFTPDPEGIRDARRAISALDRNDSGRSSTDSADFYTMSECRDLLFHVQEHQMTLPQIADFLNSADLKFLGFDIDQSILAQFCTQFPQDRTASNLGLWHLFEQERPETFVGMYHLILEKSA